VAIAYARKSADPDLLSNEDEGAQQTARLVQAGRRAVLLKGGDIQLPDHCRSIVDRAVSELGGIDILVNHAASSPFP
jgi:NAD(P)-dependent dehydrogenase (short-subunit alcohol dehydrogenase family)